MLNAAESDALQAMVLVDLKQLAGDARHTLWKTLPKIRSVLVAMGLLSVLSLTATGQDAAARIKSQIGELQRTLESKPVSRPEWKEAKPDIARALQFADDDIRVGRLYVSLEKLVSAWDSLRGTEAETQKTEEDLLKEGQPGVLAELKKMQNELTAFERRAAQKNWDAAPIAVRALAEKAISQSLRLLEGGHGFAILTDVEKTTLSENYAGALYYAGESQGQAEFSAFCNTLDLRRKTGAFPLRSILPELQQLQTRVTAAYRPRKSVENHAEFIRLNATLKLAAELDAAKLYAGALYQYLDATQQFALFDAAIPTAADRSRLRKTLHEMSNDLGGSQQDHSMAQLFLERAEATQTRSPNAAGWTNTETIVEQVLPAYFAVLKMCPPAEHQTPAEVTVTLVRWPYT
jgi:hypothetical protein